VTFLPPATSDALFTSQSTTMDRLEALGSTLSQITMYDIKSMYNQVRLGFFRDFIVTG
jgi:hypothetical protein